MKSAMTLREFAALAGVTIVPCEPAFGGRFGYKCEDYPSAVYCGYRSEMAAYKAWLDNAFGPTLAAAVHKMLAKEPR